MDNVTKFLTLFSDFDLTVSEKVKTTFKKGIKEINSRV